MGRQTFAWSVAFILAATLGVAASGQAAPRAGVTAAVVGDVTVTAEAAAKKPARAGMNIFLGDRIESETASRMQVLLLDETVFTVGPRSDLVIDKFIYDPEARTGELTASFTKGLFRYVSGKLAKANPQSIRIKVPGAVIGIRGTTMFGATDSETGGVFYGLLGPGKDNNGGLADGGFTFKPENGGATRNVARAGFGVLARNGVAGPVIRTPPRIVSLLQSQLTAAPVTGGPARSGKRAAKSGGGDGDGASATQISGQAAAETGAAAGALLATLATNDTATAASDDASENDSSNEAVTSRVAATMTTLQVAETIGSGRLPTSVDLPYAVEMTWSTISDLDLHLTGPNMSGSGRFHVYFGNVGSYSSAPYAALDADRTGRGGSEVIGIKQLFSGGVYRASVFNFGDSSSGSTSLSDQANLTMRLIRNGQISRGANGSTIINGTVLQTVSPSTGQSGNTYVGFTFDSSGTPTLVNSFTNFSSSSAVD